MSLDNADENNSLTERAAEVSFGGVSELISEIGGPSDTTKDIEEDEDTSAVMALDHEDLGASMLRERSDATPFEKPPKPSRNAEVTATPESESNKQRRKCKLLRLC